MKTLAVLGSTGSIGRSTLDVVRANPERFSVSALSAGLNMELLKEQIEEFNPSYVSTLRPDDALWVEKHFKGRVKAGAGLDGAIAAAAITGVDMVVAAISGAAGLMPTLAAIEAGKDIALANKEAMVLAGSIVMEAAQKAGVSILPVDSEHSALFQSLAGHRITDVRRVILTASGGPFFNRPELDLGAVTPQEALNHPRWSMGKKVTIDSATLINKGLEVIEARWLFGLPAERISVSIHPQSIVHSMVEYVDGSIISQMGTADMRGPIAYALGYPERIGDTITPLGLERLSLEFFTPDTERFPCLDLAYAALRRGGTAPALLNAADEVAVEHFLGGNIRFTDIFTVIDRVLNSCAAREATVIEDVLDADNEARARALEVIRDLS
ncbi:MAG: 1-deoxy-D-xylulose-5-phosphate reductoisomerase [Thermodesulfobacteriota bacterium]